MANAKRDNNSVPTVTGVSSADGATIVNIVIDSVLHTLGISNGTTGSDLSGDNAIRDQNSVTALIGVSSADGVTPVPIYATSTGKLLTKST